MRKLEAEVIHDQDRFPLDAMLDDVYGSDSDELAPEEDGNWRSEALGWDPVLEENIFRAANRSGSVCLNRIPRFISGIRAG